MSPQSLSEYTEAIAKQFKKALWKRKTELLNEYCLIAGQDFSRKASGKIFKKDSGASHFRQKHRKKPA